MNRKTIALIMMLAVFALFISGCAKEAATQGSAQSTGIATESEITQEVSNNVVPENNSEVAIGNLV